MPSVIITLKSVGTGTWQLFAPKGHAISHRFRGEKYKAIEWAKAWASGFHNWTVKLEEKDNEQEN